MEKHLVLLKTLFTVTTRIKISRQDGFEKDDELQQLKRALNVSIHQLPFKDRGGKVEDSIIPNTSAYHTPQRKSQCF